MRRESGQGYVLVLRPERIRIARANEECDLGPVTVISTAYKGRDVELETRLVDGQSFKFLIPADQQVPVPRLGSSIDIRWHPMRPLLVPEAAMGEP